MAMDPKLAAAMADTVPKINPVLGNGLACAQLEECIPYVNSLFRATAKGYPEGLTFVKGIRTTPQIEFDELTRKRDGSKYQYEIAPSSLFMLACTFKYRGEDIVRYMSLPYAEDAGSVRLGGPRFVISPFLVDRVLSVERGGIFIQFGRGRVTFERLPTGYVANGEQEKGLFVIYGNIYNRSANEKTSVRGKTTLIHYLFCKYGFEETFRRFVGTVPEFGTEETITPNTHPPEEWVICQTRNIPPSGPGFRYWKSNPMRLAIRKEHYTRDMRNYLAGFFYILDRFPTRLEPSAAVLNHTGRWRVLLGHLLSEPGLGEGHLHDNITVHIGSVDEYMDEMMRAKFMEIGIQIKDIYHFMSVMIERYEDWYVSGQDRINSLYDKELNVLDYVLADIRIAINTFYFKLTAAAKTKREQGKDLRKEDIVQLMGKYLRPGKIYGISRKHPEVTTTTTSGDNKAFKITSMMVPQSKSSRKGQGNDSGAMTDAAKQFHVSVAEIGGYANMPKSDPSGHSRVNLYVQLENNRTVLQNPELTAIREATQTKLRRKS